MAKLSILKRNGDQSSTYSTFADARLASLSGDVIIIWADLNEQIILKNLVDIWIMPGVVLDFDPVSPILPGPTITDQISSTSYEIHCEIYGEGVIINKRGFPCIYINHINSELSIGCNNMDSSMGNGTSVYVDHALKFHLFCKNILSKGSAIYLGYPSGSIIKDVNINVVKIETGDTSIDPIVGTSVVTYANGFINIGEILCKNRGHCLLHRKGDIIAKIKKVTTIYTSGPNTLSAIALIQDNIGTQKLVLYFDEINSIDSYGGIEVGQGTGVFIGRRVYANINTAIHIIGSNTKGYIKCNEIICQGTGNTPAVALDLGNFTNQITIDANYIQGYRDSGVIFTNYANVLIKNAKIKNTYTNSSPSSVGIFIIGIQIISLFNVIIITGELTNGRTIYYAGSGNIDLKNYSLFVNMGIDSNVNLKIGTGLSDPNYNYQYIVSPLVY